MTKATLFSLFFCLSSFTIHATPHRATIARAQINQAKTARHQIAHVFRTMDSTTTEHSMNRMINNLHENQKKHYKAHTTSYNHKQHKKNSRY